MEGINKTLLSMQEEWIRLVADPFVHNEPNERFSKPFLFALSDESCLDKKLIMLVGQEARNWGEYKDNKVSLTSIQQWAIDRFNKQLDKKPNDYINSPFWRFLSSLHNSLNKHDINICWNNLDKLHRYKTFASKGNSIKSYTKPLMLKHEIELNRQYEYENKSLLQREIEIVRPYAVVFLTGPSYASSMACSFGLKHQALVPLKPNREKSLRRIEHIIGLDIPVFWTYHPKYLHFMGFTEEVLNSIINSLT